MIKGLIITILSDELREHLNKISEQHGTKYHLYTEQVGKLEVAGEDEQHLSGDPVKGLKDKAAEHLDKYEYFRFLAKHIIPDEEYQLSESDLRSLQILRRFL